VNATLGDASAVAAPGKIFLIGEYAVLEGGVAVLASINRYAVARYVPGSVSQSPLVTEAMRAAVAALGARASALPRGAVQVDTSTFSNGGMKLGLGSSAATAVASVAALMETVGVSVDANRHLAFSAAEAAHSAAQGGRGSGADVAAAVYGGIIGFVRPPGRSPEIVQLSPLAQLRTVVFWTGQSESTVAMIRSVVSLAQRSPHAYIAVIERLKALADQFRQAYAIGRVGEVIDAARDYGATLAELGAAASTPIVTSRFRLAAEIGAALGGAAKPSGAGGGDIGIAFFAEQGAVDEFCSRLAVLGGVTVLNIDVNTTGVTRLQLAPPRPGHGR